MTERSCKGTKSDGSPCGAPANLIGEDGWCDAHRPGGREELQRRGRRGGYVATNPRTKAGMDLPPLNSIEAATQWAEQIALAVAEDRLSASRGNTLNRVLKTWISAYAEGESIEADRRARTAAEREVFGPRAGADGE